MAIKYYHFLRGAIISFSSVMPFISHFIRIVLNMHKYAAEFSAINSSHLEPRCLYINQEIRNSSEMHGQKNIEICKNDGIKYILLLMKLIMPGTSMKYLYYNGRQLRDQFII